MIKVEFTSPRTGTRYVRVNRRVALKAFKDGISLVVFGRMENPQSPLNNYGIWTYIDDSDRIVRDNISDDAWKEFHFKRLEDYYEYYNNNKPWWYLPESLVKNYTR